MLEYLANPLVRATFIGFWSAFGVDLVEWMKKPGWRDDGFNWNLASKRWFVGALTGFLAAVGLGAVQG